ncbi:MAG: hypothetical protein JNJ60_04870 [Rhodocyclaceae bacterium]|nr:hypothetical protein [Rhodocyclaceae bacterium]
MTQTARGAPIVRVELDAERITLAWPPEALRGAVSLPLGAARIAQRFLRHVPPAPAELEMAIEAIENSIEEVDLRLAAGSVFVLAGAWPPGLSVAAPGMDRDAVENIFQRLAALALGRPASSETLPLDAVFCAAALVLRELMHHLGVDRAMADPDGAAAAAQRAGQT